MSDHNNNDLTNKEISKILSELADLMEIKGENKFKVRAYSNAARKLNSISEDVGDLISEGRLTDLNGIGKGIGSTIEDIYQEGYSPTLEELRTELPSGVLELIEIPGLGPKRAHKLFYDLEIQSVEGLKKALLQKRVRTLKGFGPKTEEKLLKAIEEYKQYQGLVLYDEAENEAALILDELNKIAEENKGSVEEIEVAGSLRRKKEIIGDIDILISTEKPEKLCELLEQLSFLKEVIEKGETKVSIYTENNNRVDFRLIKPEEFASALQYFTGSKEHNVKMRQKAKKNGYKLNEYGLFKISDNPDGKDERVSIETEQDIYNKLEMDYIIPELREDRGEMEAAANESLPESVKLSDINGDLHVHSRFSDGAFTIEEMIDAALEMGYDYLAITDHSQSLRVAHGMSAEKVVRQRKKLNELRSKYPDFDIINGIEVDILSDGSLDYSDEILRGFDFVIASIHSGFRQSEEKMTQRIIKAINNPFVDVIGHPQGRILGRRKSYSVDMKKVIEAAAQQRVALEINASPNRLDLDPIMARKAKEAGVKLIINTDAHHIEQFKDMKLGVNVARRGWLEKEDILNTMSYDELMDYFNQKS